MIVFVAPNQNVARRIHDQLDPRARVVTPYMSDLIGWVADTIIVLPGVDLNQYIGGEATLERILRANQRLYKNPVFIIL